MTVLQMLSCMSIGFLAGCLFMDIRQTKYYEKIIDEQSEYHFKCLTEFCNAIDRYIDRKLNEKDNGGRNDRA